MFVGGGDDDENEWSIGSLVLERFGGALDMRPDEWFARSFGEMR